MMMGHRSPEAAAKARAFTHLCAILRRSRSDSIRTRASSRPDPTKSEEGPKSRPLIVSLDDVRQRAYAALLGSAIGDALGATTEFMMPEEIKQSHGVLREIVGGGWLRLPAGQVTDDTQMALCVARSIAESGWSLRDIADRFVAWLKSRPADVGNTCRRGIRRYMLHGTLAGPPFEDDAGNGAVMRMAPVAIASLADTKQMREWAIEQAHITHNHGLSDCACILVGSLVQLACIATSKLRMLQLVTNFTTEVASFGFRPYRRLCTAYVVDTMQTVLHYFFTTRTFEDCLVGTVNQGGDADTAGAIVGAIAGAYYGLDSIPRRWIKKLSPTIVEEIQTLSSKLVVKSPLWAGKPISSFQDFADVTGKFEKGNSQWK
jgi:ADP-ribosyl-[dinitrogen reductase] hydrolase